MMYRIRLYAVSFALLTLCSIAVSIAGATPAEEALARINRLPPAERQAALVKEAKTEKAVVWYAPMNREDLRQTTHPTDAVYAQDFTTKTAISTASGPRSWSIFITSNKLIARRRRSRSTTCCNRSGRERWAWTKTATGRRRRVSGADRRTPSRSCVASKGGSPRRLRFPRAVCSGEIGVVSGDLLPPTPSTRRRPAGGFHAVQKGARDRL